MAERQRSREVHVRLCDEEYEILKAKAEASGSTNSDVLRDLIVRGNIENRKADYDILRQMFLIVTDVDYRLTREAYARERDGQDTEELAELKAQVAALSDLYVEAFLDGKSGC